MSPNKFSFNISAGPGQRNVYVSSNRSLRCHRTKVINSARRIDRLQQGRILQRGSKSPGTGHGEDIVVSVNIRQLLRELLIECIGYVTRRVGTQDKHRLANFGKERGRTTAEENVGRTGLHVPTLHLPPTKIYLRMFCFPTF